MTAKSMLNKKIVCLMSGNFSQHGEPTIQDKYARAKNAIYCGADIVLELPTIFACSNAENFAFGAVKILKALDIKYLVFGVEKTNIATLWKIAKIKYNNSIEFKNCFKNEIENGVTFNVALKRAILSQINDENVKEILNKPNNILAIEYLTAILKLNANITPIAIERTDNGFNSENANKNFISATAIRHMIDKKQDVSAFIPKNCKMDSYFDAQKRKIFDKLVIGTIRQIESTELEKFYDFNDGIGYKIKKESDKFSLVDEIKTKIISPRYKESRVNKLLVYPLLQITKQTELVAKTTKPVCKCLAIKKDFKVFLSKINKNKISVIVRNEDYLKLNSNQKKIADIDLRASNIYNLVCDKCNNQDKKIGTMFL